MNETSLVGQSVIQKLFRLAALSLLTVTVTNLHAAQGPYFGLTPPGETSIAFAPAIGKVPTHPAFSPDGRECFFSASAGTTWNPRLYYTAQNSNGVWSTPVPTPFLSSQYTFEPFFSRDGTALYCTSYTNSQYDIFAVVRTSQGTNATPLPAPFNSTGSEASVSQTTNGIFYFTSSRSGGYGGNDIYRARQLTNQTWQAENLGSTINTSGVEVDPCVAPDERFLIVTKITTAATMWVYFNDRKGGWTAPVSLYSLFANGYGPDISTDGKYFFHMNAAGTECRWIAISAIDALNPLPTIKTNPVSQTALPGDNLTFRATAGGTAPLRYQWYFNQTNSLPFATNSSLTLTNVQLPDAGAYCLVVTNTLGAITSAPAILFADSNYVQLAASSPGALTFRSWIGVPFALECSSNLLQWSALTTLTNLTGALNFSDSESADHPIRFYRAHLP